MLRASGGFSGTIDSPTFTGVSSFPDGTSGAPSITFTSQATSGFFRSSGSRVVTVAAGTASLAVGGNAVILPASGVLQWAVDATIATSGIDTAVSRLAAGSAGMTTGRWSEKQGVAVASANDITLGSDGNRFQISGTTTINRILNTGWQGGSTIVLHFQGSLTVTNGVASGSNFQLINLAGAANFAATANDQLVLQYDSTAAQWFEIARTVI